MTWVGSRGELRWGEGGVEEKCHTFSSGVWYTTGLIEYLKNDHYSL